MKPNLYLLSESRISKREGEIDGEFPDALPYARCPKCLRVIWSSAHCPAPPRTITLQKPAPVISIEAFRTQSEAGGWATALQCQPLPGMQVGTFSGNVLGKSNDIMWCVGLLFFTEKLLQQLAKRGIDVSSTEAQVRSRKKHFTLRLVQPPLLPLLHVNELKKPCWDTCPICTITWTLTSPEPSKLLIDASAWDPSYNLARISQFDSQVVVDELLANALSELCGPLVELFPLTVIEPPDLV